MLILIPDMFDILQFPTFIAATRLPLFSQGNGFLIMKKENIVTLHQWLSEWSLWFFASQLTVFFVFFLFNPMEECTFIHSFRIYLAMQTENHTDDDDDDNTLQIID